MMGTAKVARLIQKLGTRTRCEFIDHSLSNEDILKLKKEPSKSFETKCRTCEHKLLAKVHPLATNSYMLIEI